MKRQALTAPLVFRPAVLFVLLLFAQSVIAADTAVFINEIHYDNEGTDSGEFVEIAGPSGTDLSGWNLVLYNGSTGASYTTTPLGGLIPDLGVGFGVVSISYPTNGIQNGAPDGLALVDDTNSVIQFLSYEGSFTAIGGLADGTLSTDMGISESGLTPIGHSLQLAGSGQTYEDFSWTEAQQNTAGSINTGQVFNVGGSAVLVINEIDYDQPGTDLAEFIEIMNIGNADAGLSQYTLDLVNGTGGGATVYSSISLPAVTLAPGDYFVVCGDAAIVPNCDLDTSTNTNLVQNGAPDAVGLSLNSVLVDTVSYEGDTGTPYTEGSGVGLEDSSGLDNIGISRYPDGTDTDQNNVDLSQRCISPGEANIASTVCSANTDLVINEIDYDQPGTDTAEFIEIRNNGATQVNLTGWSLELVNGNGTVVYQTIDLSGFSIGPAGFFVVCAGSGVANCDLDVLVDSNFIQNGAPDAVALWFDGTLIDTVSYEGDTGAPYTEGSGVGLTDIGDGSLSRCADGVDTNQNNIDFLFTSSISPGAGNACSPSTEVCGDPTTLIHDIQGNGLASSLDGTTVSIEGIVVGDFQDGVSGTHGDLDGFYVQEEDIDADANENTSEGIFVFDGSSPTVNVQVGDRVRVAGTVDEPFGMTEINATTFIDVCAVGMPVPTATEITLPVTAVADFEKYEGMLVTFPSLVISEYFNFDRFGEIKLTTDRLYQPTAVFDPGSPEATDLASLNAVSQITLDDGRTIQNPDPAIHPNGNTFDLNNRFRGGDVLENVTGVMDYRFNFYRIQPTQGALYSEANPRTAQPAVIGGSLKVAAFNVLNYFNGDGLGGGFPTSRGADTLAEFVRQRDKIIAALVTMDSDVVGVVEIENDGYGSTSAIQDLVNGLNDATSSGTYAFVDPGVDIIGTDEIAVGFIYKPSTMSLLGNSAILDSSVDPNFIDTKNRPALAQTFVEESSSEVFTVVVNHLKSKGSSCDDVGDPDTGDGSGNCNLTRTKAAQALATWLAGDPTGSSDTDFLVIGDLNAYDKEDPIDALTAAGYTDLLANLEGEFAYSYVFDAQLGYLDYALSSATLTGQVTGVTAWHINADEPDLIDYDTTFKQPAQQALYAPDSYRSSDHDPVIVGLSLQAVPRPDEIFKNSFESE